MSINYHSDNFYPKFVTKLIIYYKLFKLLYNSGLCIIKIENKIIFW